MKTFVEFLKTALLGGLFVLLPVSLLVFLLSELIDIALVVADPITLLFPEDYFDDIRFPFLGALVLIALVSLLLGLLMRSEIGRTIGSWIEIHLLVPVPGYTFLRNLINSLGNTDKVKGIRPALKMLPEGGYQAAYLVEQHSDGFCTILLPHAPAAMAGPVEILPSHQVRVLDENFGMFMQSINHWGMGIRQFTKSAISDSKGQTS